MQYRSVHHAFHLGGSTRAVSPAPDQVLTQAGIPEAEPLCSELKIRGRLKNVLPKGLMQEGDPEPTLSHVLVPSTHAATSK